MKKPSLLLLILFIANISFAQKTELIIKSGHQSAIAEAAISPDGKYLLSSEENELTILWDVRTGRQLKTYPNVIAADFGPDSKSVNLINNSFVFQTLNFNGELLKESTASKSRAIDKDNRSWFSFYDKGGLFFVDGKVFDRDKGYLSRPTYQTQTYSKALNLIAAADQGDQVSLFKLSGEKTRTLSVVHEKDIELKFIRVSPDGKYLLAGDKFILVVVDIASGNTLKTISYYEDGSTNKFQKPILLNANFSPDSKKMVVTTKDAVILYEAGAWLQSWKTAQKEISVEEYGSNRGITQFTPDGNKILIGSGKRMLLLNAVDGAHETQFFGASDSYMDGQTLIDKGALLVVKSATNSLLKWNTNSGALERPVPIDDIPDFYKAAPGGKSFFVVPSGGYVKEVGATGKILGEFQSREVRNLTSDFSLSYDGKYIAYSGTYYCQTCQNRSTEKLELFDVKTRNRMFIKSKIEEMAFANTSNKFAGIDGADPAQPLTFYDMPTGQPAFKVILPASNFGASHLLFSPSDKYFSIQTSAGIFLVEMATQKVIKVASDLPAKELAFSSTFSADEMYFIIGNGNGDVLFYDIAAARFDPALTINAHSNAVYGLNTTADGKFLYTSSRDYLIKLWDLRTRKLLATLYPNPTSGDWAVITPEGRFDASVSAQDYMYFVKGINVFPLKVLFEKLYTPKLLTRILNGEQFKPVDINIDDIHNAPIAKISYAQVVRNLNVVDDKIPIFANTSGVAEITVNASAENDKVDEIRLFHNGKIVNLATRGLFVTNNTTGTDSKTYTINLLPGTNSIRAIALNSQRTESEPDEILVRYAAAGAPGNTPAPANNNNNLNSIIASIDKNATLHLIVVGINKYQNPKLSLNYALADATAFKQEAERDARTMTTNLKTYFVTDDKANKEGILQAFKTVKDNAKANDVLIFYYAGHGIISDKNKEFYLVPNDVPDLKNVDAALEEHGIPSKLLQQYAIDIAAQKQLFILDACQSAGAFATLMTADGNQQKSLAVVARSTGTHWIAASGSQQFANEFSQLGHGAFTYVLLQALKGSAKNNNMVTVNGLKNFLQTGVPDLMKKYNGTAQYPASYGFGIDFPVEVIK